jgi:OPA family glycerol-3-phosphate transporter-like MFS transporter
MLWFVAFLNEVHHIKPGTPLFNVASYGITVGGIVGALLAGYLSDRVFQSRRPPVAMIFYVTQIACLFILGRATQPAVAAWMIGITCIWIFGVHGMLTGTASMDFGGSKGAATVAGMLDGVQYLASGLTGFLLGHFLDKWGWGAWTWMIMPFSLIGALLMTRLWNETPMRARAAPAEAAAAGKV